MIKINVIISLLILVFGIFFSCDRIEQPIPLKKGGLDWSLFPNGDSIDYPWPVWATNTNTLQNVLLEDFTGHTCTNCPAAATIAKTLENNNPNRVFIASIHASIGNSFQAIEPPEFINDYTTEEGNKYVTEIPSFFGNPSGTINRQGGGLGNTIWYLSTAWNNKVINSLTNVLRANLQVETNYYPQTRGLFIHTESDFKTNLPNEYALVMYLVRKVVISPQKLANGSVEEDYHHHNVLSSIINGAWGTTIANAPNLGDKIYNNFAIQLPNSANDSTFDIGNLYLITYIYDKSTYEVIQVIGNEL